MDILESDLAPVSFDPPTPAEVRKSEELEAIFGIVLLCCSLKSRSLGIYETQDEVTHREELLESMQNLVRESVKQILKNQVSNMDVFESRTHIQTKLQRNWPIYSRSGLFEWELTNQALISIRQCGGSWLCLGWLLVQPLSLEIYSLISWKPI